jgi:uncharacterized membrane protein
MDKLSARVEGGFAEAAAEREEIRQDLKEIRQDVKEIRQDVNQPLAHS